MKIYRLAAVACFLAGGLVQAQDVKVNILTEFWYTQMMDSSLRNNAAVKPAGMVNGAAGAATYYDGMSSSRFQENTFNIKRAEIYLNYKISDEWAGYMMFDPSLTNTSAAATTATSASGSALQDFVITYTPAGTALFIKGGQMKMPTTYESTILSARDISFFDRSQMSRLIGEKRDRGIWAGYNFGDVTGFKSTINFAISNGSTDDGTSGKTAVDGNASKDYTVRYDGSYTSAHRFGVYYRTGTTNMKNVNTSTVTLPASWTTAGVTLQTVKDNQDKTTAEGLFYAYDQGAYHFDVEYSTGLIGRRYPSLFTAAATPQREHLDQKFTGYAATAIYKMGRHQFALRYDMMNYNSGNDWYSLSSPYVNAAGADAAPKYTETTVGYNFLFVPSKYTYGKLKVDYIFRGKNFLAADPGTTSLTGGSTIMCSVMVGF